MVLLHKKSVLLYNTIKLYYVYRRYKCLKRKRIWAKEKYMPKEREAHGFFEQAYKKIKNKDGEEFRKLTRMSVHTFEVLATLLEKSLTRTSARKPIEPECRLVLTLMYLASGEKWQTLADSFRLGLATVRKIILETCDAIWNELSCIYLPPPKENEWQQIATAFYKITGLPHCAGCIDGKNIRVRRPPRSGSQCNKKYFDIVLLAAVDHSYCFTAVDIGAYGNQSDAGILRANSFGSKILKNTVKLPKSCNLPESDISLPYFFVGDAAFPLRENIMRSYPGRYLTADKTNFNEILAKARYRIENTFGILTMWWRVLCDGMSCSPENAEKIVKAVVVLHNFAILNDAKYCPEGLVDYYDEDKLVAGLWRAEVSTLKQTKLFTRFNAPKEAFRMRDILKNYVNK